MKHKFNKTATGIAAALMVTLGSISAAQADTVDFTDNGIFSTPSLTEGVVTVTGSSDIQSTSGLGIVGGINSTTLDPNETMSFFFDNPVTGVVIDSFTPADSDGNGVFMDATLTAFDENGTAISTWSTFIDPGQPVDVSAILNVSKMSGFDITMNTDGMRIGSISFQEAGGTPEFSCNGFGAPLIADDLSTADVERLAIDKKSKRTIPVKTQLFDADGFVITDQDIPAGSEPVINVTFNSGAAGSDTTIDDSLLSNTRADDGNQMRYDSASMSWIFNLGTKNLKPTGTYTISIQSADAGAYTVNQPSCTISFERK